MTEIETLRFAVFTLAAAVLLLSWRLTVTTNAVRHFRRRQREVARILEIGGAHGASPDELAAFIAATLRESDAAP